MRRTIIILAITITMLMGCAGKEYNSDVNPNWKNFNETHNDAHVNFAYSQNSFYSDGCLLGNMLYDDWSKAND